VMQLFTYNSDTLAFYKRLGFEVIRGGRAAHGGDWYLRSPAGAQEQVEAWFSGGQCRLRPLAPDDLPRYCLLYNAEYRTALKDRAQGIGTGLEAEMAFIRALDQAGRGRAAFLALDNGQTLVGMSSLVACDFPHQAHVGMVDYYLHPRFAAEAGDLIQAALAQRSGLGIEFVYALVADDEKRRTLLATGFHHRARLGGHYRVDDRRLDCDLLQF